MASSEDEISASALTTVIVWIIIAVAIVIGVASWFGWL